MWKIEFSSDVCDWMSSGYNTRNGADYGFATWEEAVEALCDAYADDGQAHPLKVAVVRARLLAGHTVTVLLDGDLVYQITQFD